jgi:hypothetical protein
MKPEEIMRSDLEHFKDRGLIPSSVMSFRSALRREDQLIVDEIIEKVEQGGELFHKLKSCRLGERRRTPDRAPVLLLGRTAANTG